MADKTFEEGMEKVTGLIKKESKKLLEEIDKEYVSSLLKQALSTAVNNSIENFLGLHYDRYKSAYIINDSSSQCRVILECIKEAAKPTMQKLIKDAIKGIELSPKQIHAIQACYKRELFESMRQLAVQKAEEVAREKINEMFKLEKWWDKV